MTQLTFLVFMGEEQKEIVIFNFLKKCIWLRDFPGGWQWSLHCRRPRFNSWVRKIPWRREGIPTPVFLPGEFHGQRSLAGYSPWRHKELDMNWVTNTYLHTLLIVDLQCCVNFYCTAEWFSYTYAYILFSCSFPSWSIIGYEIEFPVLHSRTLSFHFLLYGCTTATSCLFFSTCAIIIWIVKRKPKVGLELGKR